MHISIDGCGGIEGEIGCGGARFVDQGELIQGE